MQAYKRQIRTLAGNHGIEADELLINLWDYGSRFEYILSGSSVVKGKDFSFVVELIRRKKNNKPLPTLPTPVPVQIKYVTYDFSEVGKVDIERGSLLTREEVVAIYEALVADFSDYEDPIQPSGVKDMNLLDSAIFHPFTSFESTYKYPTVESVSAALMYALTNNHPFHNGNKRTAMVAMLVLLDKHNIDLTCSEDELFRISIRVADHKLVDETLLYPDAEIYELGCWITKNSRLLNKGERPITLKKLRQILARFECKILDNGKVKRVTYKKVLGIQYKEVLTSKRQIGKMISEGNEVDRSLIRSIRTDLKLDTQHGVDSDYFYGGINFTYSEFIHKYKTLLRRLAKV